MIFDAADFDGGRCLVSAHAGEIRVSAVTELFIAEEPAAIFRGEDEVNVDLDE